MTDRKTILKQRRKDHLDEIFHFFLVASISVLLVATIVAITVSALIAIASMV